MSDLAAAKVPFLTITMGNLISLIGVLIVAGGGWLRLELKVNEADIRHGENKERIMAIERDRRIEDRDRRGLDRELGKTLEEIQKRLARFEAIEQRLARIEDLLTRRP